MSSNPRKVNSDRPLLNSAMNPYQALQVATGAANANRPYEINLNDIIVDEEIQVRVGGLDAETLAQYIAVLENEGELPPITLFRDDAGEHYLADGFHRFRAHEETGKATIKAYVKDGNRDDAIEFAESANLEHGLKLSHADKKNILYRRIERGHEWANWSTRELGRVLGIGHNTVKRWLDEYQAAVPNGTGERREVRGSDGKVYDTTNIGKAPRPTPPSTNNESASDLPPGHTFAKVDTGNGQASAIPDDEMARRYRLTQFRLPVREIHAATERLLENSDAEILNELPEIERLQLIADVMLTIERQALLIQPLIDGLKREKIEEIRWLFANAHNAVFDLSEIVLNKIQEIRAE